ncbi:MAG: peptide synthase [Acidobacteria bacterium]|nr:MAG: peptide synthase [Acidobacteriota bacterium]
MTEGFYNLAMELERMARKKPFLPGIIFPAGRDGERGRFVQYSFQQLNQRVDEYAHGLMKFGIARGDRTLIMLRPGVELISVVFATMKIGAVPILIDPGMGRKAFLQCVAETEPKVLIGIPLAHLIKLFFPKPFKTVIMQIVDGHKLFGGTSLEELRQRSNVEPFHCVQTGLQEEAAVAFTSGGTGIPKGVVFLHGMFQAQIETIKSELGIREGEIHLAAMYIFALLNPALGVTTVIPDMDPRKTEALNPARLVEAIQTFGVTFSLGSPTVWRIVGDYCREKGIELPSVRHIYMFGAPVYPELLESFQKHLPNGTISTPYGATEALPLTSITADEILSETAVSSRKGKGVCVGRPVQGVEICIVKISDQPYTEMKADLQCAPGETGEIAVRGAMVTANYLKREDKTREAKIPDGNSFWHRMGDLGYLDTQGRVWICGRKAHRVETEHGLMLPIACEPIFNQHPKVFRSALVGVPGSTYEKPVLIVELHREVSSSEFRQIEGELREMGRKFENTRHIDTFLQNRKFPVDVRHNAKIQRDLLAKWAKEQL